MVDGPLGPLKVDAPSLTIRDGKLGTPAAVLQLEADYRAGKIKRADDRKRWSRCRQLLTRYGIKPAPDVTIDFDSVPKKTSKINREQQRERDRNYSRAYRRRNPGYGRLAK